jgi:hypothetical protein
LVIKINSATSEEFAPEQGVPQGSLLALLLYDMYCYDIYSEHEDDLSIERYILLFADDTTIVTHERTLKAILEELKILTRRTIKWFHRWRLKPNPTKLKLMIFNHKINENSPTIEVCGTTLVLVHTVKYLGVHLDPKLNFKNHAQKMKIRAIARAQHFRGLTYKNQGISQRTAAHIPIQNAVPGEE